MTKYTESMEQISTEQCGRNALNAHLECTYTVAEDGGGCVVWSRYGANWCQKGEKPKMTVQVQWSILAQNDAVKTC